MIVYNTAEKLGTKSLERLEGLTLSTVECSLMQRTIKNTNTVTSKDVTLFNTFDVLSIKDINRMTNLLIEKIEKSISKNIINTNGIIIKPLKDYNGTLRLYKTYDNNIKY